MTVLTKVILLSFSILIQCTLFSQEKEPEPYIEKSFLIIASTQDLKEAQRIAKTAATKTGYSLKDTKLQANEFIGASFCEDSCKVYGWDFPCYVGRGRYDDGIYLSVEYSNAYSGFKKGLFIVIAANGNKTEKEMKDVLVKVKLHYPKSYIKTTKVYIGCMH